MQGLQVWWLNKLHSTFPEKRSSPLRQKSYYVSSLKEHKETNKPTTNYVKQAFKMNNKPVNFSLNFSTLFTSSAMIKRWTRTRLHPHRSMGRSPRGLQATVADTGTGIGTTTMAPLGRVVRSWVKLTQGLCEI